MNKFKVGQSVYLICDSNGACTVHSDLMVINRVSIDDLGFHYSLTDSNEDIIDWCREEDVFPNKEDALKESRKRNKIILLGV